MAVFAWRMQMADELGTVPGKVWPECLFWIGMSGYAAVMVAMLVHYN